MHNVRVEDSKELFRQLLAWIPLGLEVLTAPFHLIETDFWMGFRRHRRELSKSGNFVGSRGRINLETQADVEKIGELCMLWRKV